MNLRQAIVCFTVFFGCTMAIAFSVGAADPLTFERDVRPIFRAHCYDCHGATDEMQGDLDLRLVRFMTAGGESGPVIVPTKTDESYLVQRLRSGEMPPGDDHLSARELATIERWISEGARTARPEPKTIGPGLGITQEERGYWAFQSVRRPDVPLLPQESRSRTPVDALILSVAMKDSSFAPDADRLTLVKRAYLTLTGLSPPVEALNRWKRHSNDDWFERMVDELLASPHYGERWARHWLDVAGYADSEGYTEADQRRSWAWKYRDWIIRSLNTDKPFTDFVNEQLAGDELAGPVHGELTPTQIELLTATGFLRMAADGTGSGANEPQDRNQVIADTIQIVSTALLGLSVQCAQCHDHRYDPIPQTDYYALRAVFEPAFDWRNWKTPKQRQITLYTDTDREKAAGIEAKAQQLMAEMKAQESKYMAQALKAELNKYDEPLRSQLHEAYKTPKDKRTQQQKDLLYKHPKIDHLNTGELYLYIMKWRQEKADWYNRMAEVRAKKPPEHFLRAFIEAEENGKLPETRLFHRGDHQQPKQLVTPAALTVTSSAGKRREFPTNDESLPTTGRRLALAKWLTSKDHPLVARVIVNRIWMHHFGQGIVKTPSDFGKFGTRPTHPKLLDWLADEFVRSGWSIKSLHRLIMRSTVWRQQPSDHRATQSVSESPEVQGTSLADASGNRSNSPSRAPNLRRLVQLEAETIRDRMLAASGNLSPLMFGAPDEVKEDISGQTIVDDEQTRRSIYVQVRRSQPLDVLRAFDAPVMETNCECRTVSTVATQSLMLLNGDFTLRQARELANRAAREAKPLSPNERIGLPVLPRSREAAWHFGYGDYDEDTNRTAIFTPFAHWTGKAWQGGPKMPDPKTNHAYLEAGRGHPGGGVNVAVIRRWSVPEDGQLSFAGKLSGTGRGNGIRGRIVSSRSGLAGEWIVTKEPADTEIDRLEVASGDVIDIIVDDNSSVSSDTFRWPLDLTLTRNGKEVLSHEISRTFHGPLPNYDNLPAAIMRAWELALCRRPTADELKMTIDFAARQLEYLHAHPDQLPPDTDAMQQVLTNVCQVLFGSNEFLYLD